jgi:hypothetical protein
LNCLNSITFRSYSLFLNHRSLKYKRKSPRILFLTSHYYCLSGLFLSITLKRKLMTLISEYKTWVVLSLSLLFYYYMHVDILQTSLLLFKIDIYYRTTLVFYTHYYIQVMIRMQCYVLTHISTIVECGNGEEKWVERASKKPQSSCYEP